MASFINSVALTARVLPANVSVDRVTVVSRRGHLVTNTSDPTWRLLGKSVQVQSRQDIQYVITSSSLYPPHPPTTQALDVTRFNTLACTMDL